MILPYPHHGDRVVAYLLPVWTRLPSAGRGGVAAAVLAVALVTLVVVTRVRRSRSGPLRHPRTRRPAGPVDTTWFTAHTLDGFPEEAVRATLRTPTAPSRERLYAAWVLATHTQGTDAVWLEKNLALPADAAHLITDAAEARRREMSARETHDTQARDRDCPD
ncbi:hypothetical protein ACF09J_03385 [Streptomyces sp. NPDC014889]|uniref:hypothetical protein n=1 Tax=Streptomyces sp. NPDC014889 TaxID=3364928 RepID=UPI0036FDEC88